MYISIRHAAALGQLSQPHDDKNIPQKSEISMLTDAEIARQGSRLEPQAPWTLGRAQRPAETPRRVFQMLIWQRGYRID